jgi:hypothetical protein
MTDSEIKKLNSYFRDFIISKNCKDHFYKDSAEYQTILYIEKVEDISFHNNWEYMMALIISIEKLYNLSSIDTRDNYVRFMFESRGGIQDKGFDKLNAFYLCCFKALEVLWKEKKPPFSYESGEPFAIDEFDDLK